MRNDEDNWKSPTPWRKANQNHWNLKGDSGHPLSGVQAPSAMSYNQETLYLLLPLLRNLKGLAYVSSSPILSEIGFFRGLTSISSVFELWLVCHRPVFQGKWKWWFELLYATDHTQHRVRRWEIPALNFILGRKSVDLCIQHTNFSRAAQRTTFCLPNFRVLTGST